MEAAARKLPRGALGRDALTTEGYAGKRQAARLEQQGLTTTGLGGSCREEALGMDALTTEGYAGKRQAEHCKGFKALRV